MSAIVTPELARRYLLATGQTADELRVFALVTGDEALDGFLIDFAIDRAVLGMLSVADGLLARATKLESSTKVDDSWEAMKKRRADVRHAEILRYEAERIIERAGVGPDAWEATR